MSSSELIDSKVNKFSHEKTTFLHPVFRLGDVICAGGILISLVGILISACLKIPPSTNVSFWFLLNTTQERLSAQNDAQRCVGS